MKRDFTESARQQLISLCEQVESEKWSNFTDKIGDAWYQFEEWIGLLSIEKYIDNVNAYHKKVIDKNNATEEDINEIFENVNSVSTTYKTRFDSLLTDLESYNKAINALAETISPSNGKFTPEYVGGDLSAAVDEFLEVNNEMELVFNEDLEPDDIEDFDLDTANDLINEYLSDCFASLPGISASGEKNEIRLNSHIKFYYKTSVSGNADESDVKITTALEKQKLLLKNISLKQEVDGLEITTKTDGSISFTTKADKYSKKSTSIGFDLVEGGLTGSYSCTIDDQTVKVTYKFNPLTMIFTAEISFTCTVEDVSVTSTAGLEFDFKSDTWSSLPGYEVYIPSNAYTPLVDVSWEDLEGLVYTVAVAGVIATGTVTAGVLLFPLASSLFVSAAAVISGATAGISAAVVAFVAELEALAATLGLAVAFCPA